ncbi:DNA-binding transcriptional LysR family regulator [Rhizobium mesoamericanum]|uniref:LysR family transcriptional regulator n=1 Tax=Rhizobium mesoamericanum TaxID=1079800 RepID=UPI0027862D9A|nr:LysR family transcriptional regulator [Rhizobium mesoamericanum]MDQ0560332.1 DNA-binding transcriptional LysR family regulator [Rhizobium mesoamericanum]
MLNPKYNIDAGLPMAIQLIEAGLSFKFGGKVRGSQFAELRAFAAVVQHESFAQAAKHLSMSPSALSQTIRQLETRLGVRLLNRTTRSVAPTAIGQRLFDRLEPTMAELEAAVTEAVATTGRAAGVLRINTPQIAATSVIAPRLGRFHHTNPNVVLDITIDDGLSDIVAGRFDAGIRVGACLEKDMIAVRLTPDVEICVVASPAYLSLRGTPENPADLHHHDCINWRFPGAVGARRWEFRNGREYLEMSVGGPLVTSSQEVALEGALQGLGILYSYDNSRVFELLEEGRLVRVLIDWSPTFQGLFFYYSNRRNPTLALRAFIDCLLDTDF